MSSRPLLCLVYVIWQCRKGCHRCLVIYEKHKNVLQYKESECAEIMFADESNPAPMPLHQMATILKSDLRGSHPNSNGHSDSYLSDESSNDCKHQLRLYVFVIFYVHYIFCFLYYNLFLCYFLPIFIHFKNHCGMNNLQIWF